MFSKSQPLLTMSLLTLLFYVSDLSAQSEVDWGLPLNFEGIYILGEPGKGVLAQCARDPISAKLVWRPTFEQVKIVDNRLRKWLKNQRSKFKVLPKEKFHRQYIGYTDEQGEFIYVNVYPIPKDSRINEAREPVVSCKKSKQFWGVSFSIDTFKFNTIQHNSRVVIPLDKPQFH